MPAFIDLRGQKFGALTPIKFSHGPKGDGLWLCKCDCGSKFRADAYGLRKGLRTSCGCGLFRAKQNITHGWSHTTTYACYRNMLMRCYDPGSGDYSNYGGRGIVVCVRWRKDFLSFLADMGAQPKGWTIERKNVNRSYTPMNCTWIPRSEQYKTRRYTEKQKTLASAAMKARWKDPQERQNLAAASKRTARKRWAAVKAAGFSTLKEYSEALQ
jgi:hypothetical protein